MKNRYLLPILLLSGYAGLAYELLWVRILALSFGSTTLSFSTVLGVFFGGLALGAWLAGRKAATVARPARWYAFAEIATGVGGLALYPVLTNLATVFAKIDAGSGLSGALVRLAFAVPVLLLPTLLMGATLPLVVAAVVKTRQEAGRASAYIYGLNTLGACLGVYGTTYFALPSLGVFRSLLLTAGINLLAGVITLLLERRSPPDEPAEEAASDPEPPTGQRTSNKKAQVATVCAFLGGWAAIVFQVVWARHFSNFMEGTIYGIGAVLISVLVGIALGSLLISGPLKGSNKPGVWFVGIQLLMLASVIVFFHNLGLVGFALAKVGVRPGSLVPLHLQLAITFGALVVPTICSGASLPLLVSIFKRRASEASSVFANLYTSNTIGSISGSVMAGFILLPYSGSEATVYLGLVALAATAALAAVFLWEPKRVYGLLALGAALALLAAYPGFNVRLLNNIRVGDNYEVALKNARKSADEIILYREGRNANVVVTDKNGGRALSLNGLGQGGRHSRPPYAIFESLLVALVPRLHIEAPKKAFVVGLGAGVTVDSMVQLGLQHITVAEIERGVIDAVDLIFPKDLNPVLNPKVEVKIDDARHLLLKNLARNEPGNYDIITSMPAHPWVASPIFTQEFFEIARDNLSDTGVFCTWFGTGNVDQDGVLSLLRAFTQAFDHHVVYKVPRTGALYMVGSKVPIAYQFELAQRLADNEHVGAYDELKDPYYLPLRVYFAGTPNSPKLLPGVINTDDRPVVEMGAARTGTTALPSDSLIPNWAVFPPEITEADAADFVGEYLEKLLGTPGGNLNHQRAQVNVKRASAQLSASKKSLPPAAVRYFEGRIARAQNKHEQARGLLAGVAKSDSGLWASRARRFLPMTFPPGSPQRLAGLRALPPTPDVVSWRLMEGDEVDLTQTATRANEGPLGRFLVDLAEPEAVTREGWAKHGEVIGELNIPELLQRCADVTRTAFPDLARHCAMRVVQERQRRATGVFRRAWAAAAGGDYAGAVKLFEQGLKDQPMAPAAHRGYLQATAKLGRPEALARVRQTLLFAGYPEIRINAYIEEASKIEDIRPDQDLAKMKAPAPDAFSTQAGAGDQPME